MQAEREAWSAADGVVIKGKKHSKMVKINIA